MLSVQPTVLVSFNPLRYSSTISLDLECGSGGTITCIESLALLHL